MTPKQYFKALPDHPSLWHLRLRFLVGLRGILRLEETDKHIYIMHNRILNRGKYSEAKYLICWRRVK